MSNENHLPLKISGQISRQEKIDEIQRRLRSNEAKKARALLGLVMTNYQALITVRDKIEEDMTKEESGQPSSK